MRFKNLLKKFKGFKIRKVTIKPIKNNAETQRIWTRISHGFHMIESEGNWDGSVVAQKEHVEDTEIWLFGVYDRFTSNEIMKHLQSKIFNNNLTEGKIRRKSKEIMKQAYLTTYAKIQEEQTIDNVKGSASLLVINGDKFVAASFGEYRAVLCKGRKASQLGLKHNGRARRKLSVSVVWDMKRTLSKSEESSPKTPTLNITAKKVESEAEFIILASDGVWQVMGNQEALHLIAHIEDAQEAAKCLAVEAFNRMSKSTISCVVIQFH